MVIKPHGGVSPSGRSAILQGWLRSDRLETIGQAREVRERRAHAVTWQLRGALEI